MFLFNSTRMYLRKNDMDEPPRFDEDGDSENSGQRLKHHTKRYEDPLHLQERFYRCFSEIFWFSLQLAANL